VRIRSVANGTVALALGVGLGGLLVTTQAAASGAIPVGRPSAPTHLTASVAGNTVTLHWKAPRATATHGYAADYIVVWTAPPIEPLMASVNTHSTATKYMSHFGSGTYQVAAENAAGTGPLSRPVQVATSPPPSGGAEFGSKVG
jgi:hypothetical protein